MPTYEYACSACGHEWEEIQRITAPPIDTCPKCAKSTAHRLISAGTHFVLKGGGWYSDLYASPGAAGKKSETKDTPAEGSKTASSKADTKAETKPASASGAAAPSPGGTSSAGTSSSTTTSS